MPYLPKPSTPSNRPKNVRFPSASMEPGKTPETVISDRTQSILSGENDRFALYEQFPSSTIMGKKKVEKPIHSLLDWDEGFGKRKIDNDDPSIGLNNDTQSPCMNSFNDVHLIREARQTVYEPKPIPATTNKHVSFSSTSMEPGQNPETEICDRTQNNLGEENKRFMLYEQFPTSTIMRKEKIKKPTHSLLTWEKCLEERKKDHDHLSIGLSRDIQSLCMNSFEDVHHIHEARQAVEYASIQPPLHAYHGGGDFWKLPPELPDKGNTNSPVYTATLSRTERGIIPPIDYVGIPKHITIEKGITGHADRIMSKEMWDTGSYWCQKRHEISEKVGYRSPIMDKLIVVGENIENEFNVEDLNIPEITVTDFDRNCEENDNNFYRTASILINNKKYSWTPTSEDNNQNQSQYANAYPNRGANNQILMYNCAPNERATKTIRMENIGTATITYSWERFINKSLTLSTSHGEDSHFYFNKNNGIIAPGQIIQLQFYFRTSVVGIFRESWVLQTSPNLVKKDTPITVKLYAVVTGTDQVCTTVKDIENYLQRRVTESMVREILDDVLRHSFPEETPCSFPCHVFYLEDEKFRLINPGYYYHAEIVNKMDEIYHAVTWDDQPWDMNVDNLFIIIYNAPKTKKHLEYLQFLNESQLELFKPCFAAHLHDPATSKHKIVYSLLCSFVNRMEIVMKTCGSKKCEIIEKQPQPIYKTKSTPITFECTICSETVVKPSTDHLPTKTYSSKSLKKKLSRTKATVHKKKHIKKALSEPHNVPVAPDNEIVVLYPKDVKQYLEIVYVKVYELLGETVDQVTSALETIYIMTN